MARLKSFDFNFSTKSSNTDYNKSNEPKLKFPVSIGSEKSLVELGVPKNELSRKSKSKI